MTVVVNYHAVPYPLHFHRWCDNGQIVQAALYTKIADHLNLAAWNMRKAPLFWGGNFTALAALASVYIDVDNNPTGVRPRWRAVVRTGQLVDKFRFYVAVAPETGPTVSGADPYVRVAVAQIGGGYSDSFDFHWGKNDSTLANTPNELRHMAHHLDGVPADTEIAITFSDFEGTRLFAGAIWEDPKQGTTENGFARRAYGVGQPIEDADRQELLGQAIIHWKQNAHPLFGWSSDTDALAPTRTTATYINLIDNLSTTPSSSTAGFTLDLRYRQRFTQGTLNCKMYVYAQNATSAGGDVRLVDSADNTIATVSSFSTAGEWKSASFALDADVDKYDLKFQGDGTHSFKVMAVSLFPYDS